MNQLATLLTLALLFQSPTTPQEHPSESELQRRGVEALKADRPEEAAAAFEELLKRGLETPLVHHNLGVAYQRLRRHRQASEQFRAALKLDSTSAGTAALLGASSLALGNVREAVALLQSAVRQLPDDPLIRKELAKAYRAQNQPLKSLRQHQEVVRLQPDDPEALYSLGRAYQQLSEWAYRRMTEIRPGSARIQQALAQTYLSQGRLEEAEKALEQAARSEPDLPEIHLALAHVYLQQGKWDRALKAVESELALAPSNRGAQQLKTHLLAQMGKQ